MKVVKIIFLICAAALSACGDGDGAINSSSSDGGNSVQGKDAIIESPFGFHPALVSKTGYPQNGFDDARNIGIKWTRDGLYALWFLIQPNLASPVYNFTLNDSKWSMVPADMKILANIAPQGPVDEGRCLSNSYLPVDTNKYIAFVKAVVERYDGDGINDMPGLKNPIKYWQVGNEPDSVKSGFADLQKMTYTAIKEACPDCIVLAGGVMEYTDDYIPSFNTHYKPILDTLAGQYVDVMDFHWYGSASNHYLGAKQAYDYIRSVLNSAGFSDSLPIWITEMGSYSGDPSGLVPDFPPQTERQQALDYFKRFVYPLSFGVKKIFPAFGLMEGFKHDDSYFDHTGLIYDGADSGDAGLGVKKLGYYMYKKMTEVLEGSDWNNIEKIRESSDVYIYKFVNNGKVIYAAWWDYYNDPTYTVGKTISVSLPGLAESSVIVTEVVPKFAAGSLVIDYANAFNKSTVAVTNGTALITLGDSPVFVGP